MDKPLVSVIIPTYNSYLFLCDAVDSVLSQTWRNFEIVIVDDGSTDDTNRSFTQHPDQRIRYVLQSHRGSAHARSLGVAQSTGKYIASLDADDIWLPEKLERQVEVMESHPEYGLCYTDGYHWRAGMSIAQSPRLNEVFSKGRTGWQFSFIFKTVGAATSSMFFRRDAFETVGGYDTTLRYCDAEFLIRIAARYPLVYLEIPLMAYRVHASNTSSGVTSENALFNLKFFRQLRVRALTRVQPDIGDCAVRLYRTSPMALQLSLLLYWRIRHASWPYTFKRIYRYARAITFNACP